MRDHLQTRPPAPEAIGPGIFLLPLIWITDCKTVGEEMQRLLRRRAQLNASLSTSEESDNGITWYAMTEAVQYQLDCDIEPLSEWLRDYEPDTPIPDMPSKWHA